MIDCDLFDLLIDKLMLVGGSCYFCYLYCLFLELLTWMTILATMFYVVYLLLVVPRC